MTEVLPRQRLIAALIAAQIGAKVGTKAAKGEMTSGDDHDRTEHGFAASDPLAGHRPPRPVPGLGGR
ncbi:hypothetical protein [Streptomyces sp. NPDC054804]